LIEKKELIGKIRWFTGKMKATGVFGTRGC